MDDMEIKKAVRRLFFTDSLQTFDRQTIDSTGAFLIGELERLDQELHLPLASYTWNRDITLREDVSIADENSSFTNSIYGMAGGINPTGKNWIGKDTNAIQKIQIDIGKTMHPLTAWGVEIAFTIMELESAIKIGRPLDVAMYEGMQLKWRMDVDEQVYIGDSVMGFTGLLNEPKASKGNVPIGSAPGATTAWATKTEDEILADVNEGINAAWAQSGYKICPSELRVPPAQLAMLSARKVSQAGNMSILKFLEENSLSMRVNGKPLNIAHIKWLTGTANNGQGPGVGGADRMVFYTNEKDKVRFPLVPLQRTPLEYRSIYQITTYFGRLGCVEVVYPETLLYRDGI